MAIDREIAELKAYAEGGPETPGLRSAARIVLTELGRTKRQAVRAFRERKQIHGRLEHEIRDKPPATAADIPPPTPGSSYGR